MPPHADVLQWEHLPFPKSLRDFQRLFPTDTACAHWLEGAKWPKGFECPHCHEKGEPQRLSRPGVLACRSCRMFKPDKHVAKEDLLPFNVHEL
jgi:Transposase zinc-ribbon domain